MFHPGGGPLPILFSILTSVVSVVAAAIVFLVVIGLLFLLVRFLWFGTRAAQVYLVKNGEPGRFTWPIRPVGESEPATDAPAPASAPASTPTDAPNPTAPTAPTTPRKPKSPPAS